MGRKRKKGKPQRRKPRQGWVYSNFDVLEYIDIYWHEKKYGPSIREIAQGCGIPSTHTVWDILADLERKRLIRRAESISRSVHLTNGGKFILNRVKRSRDDKK